MRTYRDAKIIAETLREELARRHFDLAQTQCLEIVARQFGLGDWNELSARLGEVMGASHTLALSQPKGWTFSGQMPQLYEGGIDTASKFHLGHPALIRCRLAIDDPSYPAIDPGFATLMQSVVAAPFRGHRMALRAELRTEAVETAATLWMRVDGQAKQVLAFDNMEGRSVEGPLTGSTDWLVRSIVLDVPAAAESLHYGFYLRGPGAVWARNFELREAVADESLSRAIRLLAEPTNLDFSEIIEPPGLGP